MWKIIIVGLIAAACADEEYGELALDGGGDAAPDAGLDAGPDGGADARTGGMARPLPSTVATSGALPDLPPVGIATAVAAPPPASRAPEPGSIAATQPDPSGRAAEVSHAPARGARLAVDGEGWLDPGASLPALSRDRSVVAVAVPFGTNEHVCEPGGFDVTYFQVRGGRRLGRTRIHSLDCDDQAELSVPARDRGAMKQQIDSVNRVLAKGGFRRLERLTLMGDELRAGEDRSTEWRSRGLTVAHDATSHRLTATRPATAASLWTWTPPRQRYTCDVSLPSYDTIQWTHPWLFSADGDASGLAVLSVGLSYGSCMCSSSETETWLVAPGRRPRRLR